MYFIYWFSIPKHQLCLWKFFLLCCLFRFSLSLFSLSLFSFFFLLSVYFVCSWHYTQFSIRLFYVGVYVAGALLFTFREFLLSLQMQCSSMLLFSSETNQTVKSANRSIDEHVFVAMAKMLDASLYVYKSIHSNIYRFDVVISTVWQLGCWIEPLLGEPQNYPEKTLENILCCITNSTDMQYNIS